MDKVFLLSDQFCDSFEDVYEPTYDMIYDWEAFIEDEEYIDVVEEEEEEEFVPEVWLPGNNEMGEA